MVTTSFIPPLFPYTLYFPRCRVDRAALKALKRKKEKGEREREREREKKERGTRDAVSLACFAPVWRRVNRIFREEVRRARITLSLSLPLSCVPSPLHPPPRENIFTRPARTPPAQLSDRERLTGAGLTEPVRSRLNIYDRANLSVIFQPLPRTPAADVPFPSPRPPPCPGSGPARREISIELNSSASIRFPADRRSLRRSLSLTYVSVPLQLLLLRWLTDAGVCRCDCSRLTGYGNLNLPLRWSLRRGLRLRSSSLAPRFT